MKKHCLTLLIILSSVISLFAQTDSLQLSKIITKLDQFTATSPIEKVYLHLNKPNYNTGDTIWFKGYLTISEHHLPSALSSILYVELINNNNKIVRSLKLKNINGIALGDIDLDDKIAPGNYRLRAYTNWMRNAGPDYFFLKNINIGDIKSNALFITAAVNPAGKTGESAVSATLNFTDKYGRPYDRKPVSYEVREDTSVVYKGGGITDGNGSLIVTFPDKVSNQKPLNIYSNVNLTNNITVSKTVPLSLEQDNLDVQFFPEGGQMVNGVRSKIAFKAIGTNGLGVNINGTIVDSDNKEVANFSAQHAGMGIFALIPVPGKTYTAKIKRNNKPVISVQLPAASDKGFVLGINNTDSLYLNVRIATNATTLNERKGQSFYLVAQSNGAVYFTTLGKLDDAVFAVKIPKAKFPSGVVQFTLFNSNNEPVNERLSFINNRADILDLNLRTEKDRYTPKEQVNLTLAAKNNGKPAIGTYSVSVFTEDKLGTNENVETSILSNILLTSDIKGYVEDPAYYFNHTMGETIADLDVLMLTQGYRRFDWKKIINGPIPPITFQPEKGFSISGRLTNASDKPVVKGRLKVLALSEKTIIDTVTDADGKFALHDVAFPDSTRLVIEARKANDGRNVNITLDNQHTIPLIPKNYTAEVTKNILPPFLNRQLTGNADTSQIASDIKAGSSTNNMQLKEVKITAKKDREPSKYNNYGAWREVNVDMTKARQYNTVFEAIQRSVPGVYIQGNTLINPYAMEKKGDNMRLTAAVVNGRELGADFFEFLDPHDVETISFSGRTVFITTRSYAGTDTVQLKQASPNLNQGKLLNEVNVKSRKSTGSANAPWMSKVKKSANLSGPGHADYIYGPKDLANCLDLVGCIINKLPGIRRGDVNFYFSRSTSSSLTAPQPIRFMLDGLILENTIPLDGVNVSDVSSVEVLQNNALLASYGSQASGGLIIITTKIGADDNEAIAAKSAPGVLYTRFNGYYQPREFYTPKYTVSNKNIPDNRTAIYWNPIVATDANGTVMLKYFNSDIKGGYKAVIEGIDNDGNIGRYVYRYTVQ